MIKKAYPSGLMYLCKTNNKDPYKYTGSGTYWKRHIKKNNSKIITCVIGEYETNDDLRNAGLEYSEKYNICESKEWANIIPESGDGGDTLSGKHPIYNPTTDEVKYVDANISVLGWIKGYPKNKRSALGRKRYHNPITNEIINLKPTDDIPDGFKSGGLKGVLNYGPTKGTIVYHNNRNKTYIKPGDDIPFGYKKGSGKGSTTGKIAHHNPYTGNVIFLHKDDIIPKGYIKGNFKKNGSKEWKPITVNGIDFCNIQQACKHFNLTRYKLMSRLDSKGNLITTRLKHAPTKVKIDGIVFKTITLAMKHFNVSRYKLKKMYNIEYI